jgi:flavin-binding protein dodecin
MAICSGLSEAPDRSSNAGHLRERQARRTPIFLERWRFAPNGGMIVPGGDRAAVPCRANKETRRAWNQTRILQEETVSEHVYKKIELIGSSPNSIDEAIEGAISRASKTTRNLDWFEVDQIRGQIVNGKVAHYQVVMKVGFRIDD